MKEQLEKIYAEATTDIENASKEQLMGIEQINDAVSELDRQTQQNAMVSSQTHDIALVTDEIAKEIVKEANSKDFIGKDSAKARDFHKSNTTVATTSNKKPTIANIEKKESIKDSDEWENF